MAADLTDSGPFLDDEDVVETSGSSSGPSSGKWVRGCLILAGLALYSVYSLFGIAAPFWWGHHGYHGAIYLIRARMSLRQHMLLPATWGGFETPPKAALYLHHPIGYHHIYTLLIPLVGDREWLARGGAMVGGLLALYALYYWVRRFWSSWAAVFALWIYITLPVLVTFSVLCDPMLLEFVCVLWAIGSYLEYRQSARAKWLLQGALAFAVGGLLMWEVYFLAPFIFLHACISKDRMAKREKPPSLLSFWLYFGTIGLVCAADLAFHFGATYQAGVWGDFVQSYKERHGGASWGYVIERHKEWLRILYGSAPVFVGFVWLAVGSVRAAFGKTRKTDFVILSFFYLNTLYIFLFAEGSSVHLYRVFFYSGFFALAFVDLVSDAVRAARYLVLAVSPMCGRAGVAVIAIFVGVYFRIILPQDYATLLESRATMGTHQPGGYTPERQKMAFASEVHRRTSIDERVIIHYGHLGARKEFWYYIDRSFDEITHLGQLAKYHKQFARSVLLLDETRLDAAEKENFRKLIAAHPVIFFEQFTMVDLRKDQPLASSFAYIDRPMSKSYRFWVSHIYPPLGLVPRSYLQGECRALESVKPIPIEPGEELRSPGQAALLPCYHNLLVARGENSQAAEVHNRLIAGLRQIDEELGSIRPTAIAFSGNRLRVLYQSRAPEQAELRYVVRRAKAAPVVLAASAALPPLATWRNGFIYIDEVTLPAIPTKFSIDAELVRKFSSPGFHPPLEWSREEVVARVELGAFVR